MIRHDSPVRRPIRAPAAARFRAPNESNGRTRCGVSCMTVLVEVPSWLPRLLNWLAVLVLLSLGVLS